MGLFAQDRRANEHSSYAALADSDWDLLIVHRDRIDAMWRQCEPYMDEGFVADFPIHYPERCWELRVAFMLLKLGMPLVPRGAQGGPDFQIAPHHDQPRTWVEAVTVTHGGGADAVIEPPHEGSYRPNDRRVMLRYTSAIAAKVQQRADWKRGGVVDDGDAFIIAVNPGVLVRAALEHRTRRWCETPWIVRVLYGIGGPYVAIPIGGWEHRRFGVHAQPVLSKASGVTVGSQFFCEPESAPISAVLFGREDILNAPELHGSEVGRDCMLVHNACASVPLTCGWLGRGEEWSLREDPRARLWFLHRADHRITRTSPPLSSEIRRAIRKARGGLIPLRQRRRRRRSKHAQGRDPQPHCAGAVLLPLDVDDSEA